MTAPIQSAPEALHDHIDLAVRSGQDAINTAIGTWVNGWQHVPWKQLLGLSRTDPRHVPNIDQLIDTWFDIGGELLNAQRELTKAFLDLSPAGLAALVLANKPTTTASQPVTE